MGSLRRIETEARKLTAAPLTDLRKRAVTAVQSGESPEKVAQVFGIHCSTRYGWLARYRGGGWDRLDASKRGGRPPKRGAKSLAMDRRGGDLEPARAIALPLWTVQLLRQRIAKHRGVRLGKSSVHRLLGQLGLTAQRPLWRAWQQDSARAWKATVYPGEIGGLPLKYPHK